MSRKGNCWDRVMERFFLSLKRERVWLRDYANVAEATRDITEYRVGFCKPMPAQATLGCDGGLRHCAAHPLHPDQTLFSRSANWLASCEHKP
jgi:transposase InsO family protein